MSDHLPTRTDLSRMNATELRSVVSRLEVELRNLHADEDGEMRNLTAAEQARFDELMELADTANAHLRLSDTYETRPRATETAFQFAKGVDSRSDTRSRALALLDKPYGRSGPRLDHLTNDQRSQIEELVRRDDINCNGEYIAKRILLTESPEYRSAWSQLVTQTHPVLTSDEAEAIRALQTLEKYEARAMSIGTDTAGGFGVPVFIDPSIILTSQGSGNVFRQISRVENITTSRWKGVNSAGVSWSFDAEASTVSDDSPTLAQPTVDVYTARGFVPFSIEVGQDYPAFAEEMASVLAEGYEELLVQKFSVGSGSGEPRGILTALDANTNVEVVSTTDGSFGQEDLYKVWKALPQRFRRNASWMMSLDVNNRIRQFGTANVFHAFTENLPTEWADQLFGKQVYESPYFPDFTGTTGAENRLVVGDFRNFVIAQRAGLSIELVPHLFDVTNNRPTGSRGWFAWARIGSNTSTDLAFRLLQNQ